MNKNESEKEYVERIASEIFNFSTNYDFIVKKLDEVYEAGFEACKLVYKTPLTPRPTETEAEHKSRVIGTSMTVRK